MVPMAGVVDVDKELARLDKELERMMADQAGRQQSFKIKTLSIVHPKLLSRKKSRNSKS